MLNIVLGKLSLEKKYIISCNKKGFYKNIFVL